MHTWERSVTGSFTGNKNNIRAAFWHILQNIMSYNEICVMKLTKLGGFFSVLIFMDGHQGYSWGRIERSSKKT